MKIVLYCQHVLGVGHFFRSLELVKALDRHEVILVTGGPPVEVSLPSHAREARLPALAMDENFSQIHAVEEGAGLEAVKRQRISLLHEVFATERPDLFLVELYPFGRKAFGFELQPVLEQIKDGGLPPCKVVCSLRDILVEKKDPHAYENRVVNALNNYFSGLAIHADPALVDLSQTFASLDRVRIPVQYTGFVSPAPRPGVGEIIRKDLNLSRDDVLITASAGGGKVGHPLLRAVIQAFAVLPQERMRLHVFTGPFLEDSLFRDLQSRAGRAVTVARFTRDFPSWLDASDLSVSMAGYNTCMNLLAARVRALVWPFAQNREQSLRAGKLQSLGALEVLDAGGLDPQALSVRMARMLERPRPQTCPVNLDGAARTASWLEQLVQDKGGL